MVSISLVLTPYRLGTITPSTTYKGVPVPLNSVPPRTEMVGEAPGSPVVCCTRNPETVPCKAVAALVLGAEINASLLTLETHPESLDRRWVPYPTTTTSSTKPLTDTSHTLVPAADWR